MIYYELRPAAADHHGPFGLLNNSIVDRMGLKVCSGERGVQPSEIAPGVDVRTVTQSYLAVGRQKRLADLLTYSFERALILREGVLHEFEAAGIRLAPDIHRWTLDVVDSLGGSLRGKYTVLWPLSMMPVLDEEYAKVTYYPSTKVVRRVDKWALNTSMLDGVDLVRTSYNVWLASDRIREVVSSQAFSGFDFRPLV